MKSFTEIQCRLCLKEKPLLNKSHIFPKYFAKTLVDEKKRLVQFSIKGELKEKIVQSTYWEKNILCSACDRETISKLENYAKINLFDVVRERFLNRSTEFQYEAERINLDYNKIKLFLLSIIWRCSISKSFKIHLGIHQEAIREMILNNNPKTSKDYPFFILCLLNEDIADKDSMASKLLLSPRYFHKDSCHAYDWMFPGFYIQVYFSKHNVPSFIYDLYKNDNSLLLRFAKKGHEEEWVKPFLKTIKK